MSKINICLNMIVKDESKVIERLLHSLAKVITSYAIVDTGSTDGTQDIIKKTMDVYNIPGVIINKPWINFKTNRNQALELIPKDFEGWALIIDADETLHPSDNFLEQLESDSFIRSGVSYQIQKRHSTLKYPVTALLYMNNTAWEWNGPVHEYLEQKAILTPIYLLDPSLIHIVSHVGEGNRSTSVTQTEKFLADAELLKKELEINPKDSRSQFYLAQSYRDAGYIKEAIVEYYVRLDLEGYDEEIYISLLNIARLLKLVTGLEDEIERCLHRAIALIPHRVEALHELALLYRLRADQAKLGLTEQFKRFIYNDYFIAYLIAKEAVSKRTKNSHHLFTEANVCNYLVLDELGVCAYWSGRYIESSAAYKQLFYEMETDPEVYSSVPEIELKRLRDNYNYALKACGKI